MSNVEKDIKQQYLYFQLFPMIVSLTKER